MALQYRRTVHDAFGKMKILIVEDEAALMDLTAAALRKEGFVVETAMDYATAGEKLSVYTTVCCWMSCSPTAADSTCSGS